METIVLPKSITVIQLGTFSECTSLKNVTIPNGVTTIASYPFENCSALETIELPESITEIGADAFKGCTSLRYVICNNSTPPTLYSADTIFPTNSLVVVVYVPDGAVDTYKGSDSWKTIVDDNRIEVKPLSECL